MSKPLNINTFVQADFPLPPSVERTAGRKAVEYLQMLCVQTGFPSTSVYPLELLKLNEAPILEKKAINAAFFALVEAQKGAIKEANKISDAHLESINRLSLDIVRLEMERQVANYEGDIHNIRVRISNYTQQIATCMRDIARTTEELSKVKGAPAIDYSAHVSKIVESGFFRFGAIHDDTSSSGKLGIDFLIGPIHWRHKAQAANACYDVNFGSFKIFLNLRNGNVTLFPGENNLVTESSCLFPYASRGTDELNGRAICFGDATDAAVEAIRTRDTAEIFRLIESIFSRDTFGSGFSHPLHFMRYGAKYFKNFWNPIIRGYSVWVPVEVCNDDELSAVMNYIDRLRNTDSFQNESQTTRAEIATFYREKVQGKHGDPDRKWLRAAETQGFPLPALKQPDLAPFAASKAKAPSPLDSVSAEQTSAIFETVGVNRQRFTHSIPIPMNQAERRREQNREAQRRRRERLAAQQNIETSPF